MQEVNTNRMFVSRKVNFNGGLLKLHTACRSGSYCPHGTAISSITIYKQPKTVDCNSRQSIAEATCMGNESR